MNVDDDDVRETTVFAKETQKNTQKTTGATIAHPGAKTNDRPSLKRARRLPLMFSTRRFRP